MAVNIVLLCIKMSQKTYQILYCRLGKEGVGAFGKLPYFENCLKIKNCEQAQKQYRPFFFSLSLFCFEKIGNNLAPQNLSCLSQMFVRFRSTRLYTIRIFLN